MRFTLSIASLAALVGMVSAQSSCPEAARFGFTTATPSTGLNSGDQFTITSNFTCSISKGINPAFVDYYIHNTINNNGHEPPVLVTRRTNPATVDTFTATLPAFPVWFSGANYTLQTVLTYPVTGSDGNPVLITAQNGDVAVQIVPNA